MNVKNQILTFIFTLYFRIIYVHKLLRLSEICVNYAVKKIINQRVRP